MNAQFPDSRRVKLFRNGRSQAVRIPKEFELRGDEVIVRKESDNRLVIEVAPRRFTSFDELTQWLLEQKLGDEAFPEIVDFPPEPVDLGV